LLKRTVSGVMLTLPLIVLLTVCMIEFLFFRTPVLNVSAVETADQIEVYWNENCSLRVNSIDWGVLSPDEVKKVVVYVRNEGNESFLLVLTPANWNPQNASRYLSFSWSYKDDIIGAGEVVKVTLSLYVSSHTRGISNFSFDIIFETRKYFLGDINKDGVVDLYDAVILSVAYGSTPSSPNWNPNADINSDKIIDIYDAVILVSDYGKQWRYS